MRRLRPSSGLERLDSTCNRHFAAIAAAFADLPSMKKMALSRIFPFPALAQTAALRGAGLVVEDDRHVLVGAEILLHRFEFRARNTQPGGSAMPRYLSGSSVTTAIFFTVFGPASSCSICEGDNSASTRWPPVIETKPL